MDGFFESLDIKINIGLFIGAGVVLLLGLFSGYIKRRLYLSEPFLCLLVGVSIGPLIFGLISPQLELQSQHELLKQVARVTLAISVMGAALRLEHRYVQTHWRELALVLGPIMLLMWLATSTLAYLVVGLPILLALLVGATLTPTDPVLADSVLSGHLAHRNIPTRLRSILTAESGANDGLGLLLVMLPILLLAHPPGEGLSHWFLQVLLWDVLGGVALGVVLGGGAALLLNWVRVQPFSSSTSFLTVGIALALTVLSGVHLMGGDGILAVFVAGVTFNRLTGAEEGGRPERIEDAVSRFFDLPVFIVLGIFLPWSAWLDRGWGLLLFALLVLALRRLPAWLLLRPLLPSLHASREALFCGWFGPLGIAALYYVTLSAGLTARPLVWEVASLVITSSVALHGFTATPMTRRFFQ